jgi:ABC-type Fe3+-hydroxamate transport system substrate-binding protein
MFHDQLSRPISLSQPPKRIISLVPSQTEYLWDLGLQQEIVGITKFCIHPDEMYRTVERVGGTKQLDIAKIQALQPDLIIGNKEENEKSQIEALENIAPVYMSDVNTLDDAYAMMFDLAKLCGKEEKGRKLINSAKTEMDACKNVFDGKKVLYCMWYQPWMAVASDTFIDGVLLHLGFENVLKHKSRYPEFFWEEIKELHPDYIFLSSEPFPFSQKHKAEVLQLMPNTKVVQVDGERFSWYGSRLILAGKYFMHLRTQI